MRKHPAPPRGWWFDPKADKINTYNPALARSLVKKLPWPNGFTFDLEIPATPYLVDVKDAAVAIQEMLHEVGIAAKIRTYETAIATTDREKLKRTFSSIQTFCAEQSPGIWLGFVNAIDLWRTNVKDFKVQPGSYTRAA